MTEEVPIQPKGFKDFLLSTRDDTFSHVLDVEAATRKAVSEYAGRLGPTVVHPNLITPSVGAIIFNTAQLPEMDLDLAIFGSFEMVSRVLKEEDHVILLFKREYPENSTELANLRTILSFCGIRYSISIPNVSDSGSPSVRERQFDREYCHLISEMLNRLRGSLMEDMKICGNISGVILCIERHKAIERILEKIK